MGWLSKTKPEARQSGGIPFSDAVTAAIVAAAGGTSPADPSGLSALEAAAGLYASAFAAAEIKPANEITRAITPQVRGLIARDLIRRGESLHHIEVDRAGVRLIPAGSWDVRGPWRESEWWYRLDLFGPSGNVTRFVPAQSVIHNRYAVDPARPWLGIGPLTWARATGALAANLEARLGEEAGGSVAHVLPIPADGGDGSADDPLASLKADIKAAQGGTILTETTSGGWGEGRIAAPNSDWKPNRIGANPPATLPTLRRDVFEAVIVACGVPVSLVTDADGTSQREAYRRWYATSVTALGDLVAAELTAKLETPVSFDFSHLYAHDLAGRAQAFQKLIAGGMSLDRAVNVCGLVTLDR